MILERFPEVRRLSPADKLAFVTELWNDLEANPAQLPVSSEILEELDRRMDHFSRHPEEFTTWESVKKKLLRPKS